jgi:hypothetical protein
MWEKETWKIESPATWAYKYYVYPKIGKPSLTSEQAEAVTIY